MILYQALSKAQSLPMSPAMYVTELNPDQSAIVTQSASSVKGFYLSLYSIDLAVPDAAGAET